MAVLALATGGPPRAAGGVARGVEYRGVNLAGAEFGEGTLPGTFGVQYTYPAPAEVDYLAGKGMNTIRLPFRWERLQPVANGAFDSAELGRLDAVVSYATGRGVYVVLDPHNYARYYGQLVGSAVPNAVFADFWSRLAARYRDNPRVLFGLMNEPHSMQTEQWVGSANAAIVAIRAAGAANVILVPGNAWSGAHSWGQDWYGTPNATAMLGVVDSGTNLLYEVHQYLDDNSSGTSDGCVSQTIGAERLAGFTAWLRSHGQRGFLGEFAGGRSAACLASIDTMLRHVHDNADVWAGWAWWAAGPWWGDYIFSVAPNGGQDRPQMTVLASWASLGSSASPTPPPGASPTPGTPTPSPTLAANRRNTPGLFRAAAIGW